MEWPFLRSAILSLVSVAVPVLLVSLYVMIDAAGLISFKALERSRYFGWGMLGSFVLAGLIPIWLQRWPVFWRLLVSAVYIPVMSFGLFGYLLGFACAYTGDCI
ncbi:hypothetical protein [Sphingomonas sp. LT1P40]|uniref:hypothetical protein n=1 Tax=Alteristakelama amylovorans TaxID=3096166 RepID=UPI002FC98DC4